MSCSEIGSSTARSRGRVRYARFSKAASDIHLREAESVTTCNDTFAHAQHFIRRLAAAFASRTASAQRSVLDKQASSRLLKF
jgi:hypothetical protein